MHHTWNTNPLHNLYEGGLENCNFCWMSCFQEDPAQKWCNGFFCIDLIESKLLYNFGKKFRRCAFRYWSYSNSNTGDRNVCAQIYCKNLQVRTEDHIIVKISLYNSDPKNWTYITNNAFWRPLAAVDLFDGDCQKTVILMKFALCATRWTNVRTRVLYIRRMCRTQKHTDNKYMITMKWA